MAGWLPVFLSSLKNIPKPFLMYMYKANIYMYMYNTVCMQLYVHVCVYIHNIPVHVQCVGCRVGSAASNGVQRRVRGSKYTAERYM